MVGSYNGRLFNFPIVDSKVHEMAASMGNMQSYVGGMSGRTGVDESNAQSYKESFRASGSALSQNFSGQPRSLSERMAMDRLREDSEDDEGGNGTGN